MSFVDVVRLLQALGMSTVKKKKKKKREVTGQRLARRTAIRD